LVELVKELKAECGSLNQRLLSVENKNKNQDIEINILKHNLTIIREEVKNIEKDPSNKMDTSSTLLRRGRPARLIPLELNFG